MIIKPVKIKDKELKKLVWSTQLSDSWREYQFEKSEIESEKRFFWSSLTASLSMLGILVSLLFLFHEIKEVRITLIVTILLLIISFVYSAIKIRQLSIKKVEKRKYVKTRSLVTLLEHFNEDWFIAPVDGSFYFQEGQLTELQSLSIDTEKWIKAREKISKKRRKELLNKIKNNPSTIKLEKGEEFETSGLIEIKGQGQNGEMYWASGYIRDKAGKLPFICFDKKIKLEKGLFKIKGKVSDASIDIISIVNSKNGKLLLIEESKLIERFYDLKTQYELKENSPL